jgi:hypothetical protein
MEELERSLERCAQDGSPRSFSAALRIGREQLLARENPGMQRSMLIIALFCLGVSLVATPFFSGEGAQTVRKVQIACAGAAGVILIGLVQGRAAIRAGLQEERRVAELTLRCLEQIASGQDFQYPQLDGTQRGFLRSLLKRKPRPNPVLTRIAES